jgi:UDP-glucuronate decarboxylase
MPDVQIVDVRDLVDRAGNQPSTIREKIQHGCQLLTSGRKTVVCCDHGISRSNAVAAGILSCAENVTLDAAIRRVLEATGESEMRLDVVDSVRRAVDRAPSIGGDQGRWLLTGGRGYLGSILHDSATTEIELLRPGREELDLLRGEVELDLYVREHQVSRILHFAAPRVGNTNSSLGEAMTMLRNVLDVCATNRIMLFVPSRWEVFGGYGGQTLHANEQTPLRPAGTLGDAKYLAEKLVEAWSARDRLQVTVLRSGLVFGGGGAPNFINSFIRKTLRGEAITTHVYRNGSPQLDLIHSKNWAQACWRLLLSGHVGTYHAGGGKLLSTQQIAEIISQSCGTGRDPENLHIEDETANVSLGFDRLSSVTGWQPSGDVALCLSDFAKSHSKAPAFVSKEQG